MNNSTFFVSSPSPNHLIYLSIKTAPPPQKKTTTNNKVEILGLFQNNNLLLVWEHNKTSRFSSIKQYFSKSSPLFVLYIFASNKQKPAWLTLTLTLPHLWKGRSESNASYFYYIISQCQNTILWVHWKYWWPLKRRGHKVQNDNKNMEERWVDKVKSLTERVNYDKIHNNNIDIMLGFWNLSKLHQSYKGSWEQ